MHACGATGAKFLDTHAAYLPTLPPWISGLRTSPRTFQSKSGSAERHELLLHNPTQKRVAIPPQLWGCLWQTSTFGITSFTSRLHVHRHHALYRVPVPFPLFPLKVSKKRTRALLRDSCLTPDANRTYRLPPTPYRLLLDLLSQPPWPVPWAALSPTKRLDLLGKTS